MKPFITIATPHRDILEGRFTMDIFAADLWQVFKGNAPVEYKDPDVFFKRTFLTNGLRNLLSIAEKRLKGESGDPVIQLQTPFGGGKTHALIALYHKAREWGSKVVVIDGTVFDVRERTLWEEMELQLTGKIELLKGEISPGREKIQALFSRNQPLLILIDELLEYMTKASGIKVGDSNLASQSLAFIQELTMAVRTLDKSLVVFTLPSSLIEHYDESIERLFQQIQHITGRVEKVYTPVEDEEVPLIIVRRLFSTINEREAKHNIEEFLDYAEREKILPEGVDKSHYREKFTKSFPFQPEVIDVLYKRWGSFPSFQRTRGVLRILGLVVQSLKDSKIPFIRLGDVDLRNEEIRRELVKHIGNEFDSILAADITSPESGAKKVDKSIGDAYLPYSLGTKCATAIFMYSFSGGPEKGVTLQELKLSCADVDYPSSIVVEVVEKLRENLFYLSDAGLFFTNQPNLNRIFINKSENIKDIDVENEEKKVIENSFPKKGGKFNVFLWPDKSKDIPDNKELKLVVLKDYSKEKCKDFLENFGDKPRIYRNTLIFLCPSKDERPSFNKFVKDKLTWELIGKDKSLNLSEEQRKEVTNRIKKFEEDIKLRLRDLYRYILLPSKEELKEVDLGIQTYGKGYYLDEEVYNRLKGEEILERLSDLTIKEKYLKNDYVSTKDILESFYTTPGEIRIVSEEVFKEAIKEGVKKGSFGLGRLENNKPVCTCFKKECTPEISEGEVIIKAELCEKEEYSKDELVDRVPSMTSVAEEKVVVEEGEVSPSRIVYKSVCIKFKLPYGKLSEIASLMKFINSKFKHMEIVMEISAKGGNLEENEYRDKIEEALKQAGAEIEVEKLE